VSEGNAGGESGALILSSSTACLAGYVATNGHCVKLKIPVLSKTYSGDTFFNDWEFQTIDDPTHGQVTYAFSVCHLHSASSTFPFSLLAGSSTSPRLVP
jgi:hypothetical protein